MTLTFHALPYETVAAWRGGAPDDYGADVERVISSEAGNPCRSCLEDIEAGEPVLLLAHRPFPAPQPYAETGPIFVHAECAHREAGAAMPPVVASRREFLVKGYGHDDRIAYVDLRSAVNNCFICRVTAG